MYTWYRELRENNSIVPPVHPMITHTYWPVKTIFSQRMLVFSLKQHNLKIQYCFFTWQDINYPFSLPELFLREPVVVLFKWYLFLLYISTAALTERGGEEEKIHEKGGERSWFLFSRCVSVYKLECEQFWRNIPHQHRREDQNSSFFHRLICYMLLSIELPLELVLWIEYKLILYSCEMCTCVHVSREKKEEPSLPSLPSFTFILPWITWISSSSLTLNRCVLRRVYVCVSTVDGCLSPTISCFSPFTISVVPVFLSLLPSFPSVHQRYTVVSRMCTLSPLTERQETSNASNRDLETHRR